jgi:hypothetical protein
MFILRFLIMTICVCSLQACAGVTAVTRGDQPDKAAEMGAGQSVVISSLTFTNTEEDNCTLTVRPEGYFVPPVFQILEDGRSVYVTLKVQPGAAHIFQASCNSNGGIEVYRGYAAVMLTEEVPIVHLLTSKARGIVRATFPSSGGCNADILIFEEDKAGKPPTTINRKVSLAVGGSQPVSSIILECRDGTLWVDLPGIVDDAAIMRLDMMSKPRG